MSDTDTNIDSAAIEEQARENVDAWISQDPKKMEWANRPDNGLPDRKPGESVYRADPAKGDDPIFAEAETTFVERAATTLAELGPEGQALVQAWGGPTSHDFQENLSYAKSAFKDIATNRPDLIEKFDASGLGNDPAVLEFLAKHGRLSADFRGDNSMSSRYSAPSGRSRPLPRGQSAAQAELNKIFKESPPGSAEYRTSSVQNRVRQLSEMIAGGGSPVGTNGRTA